MRSRLITVLVTAILLLACATTAFAGEPFATSQRFPDDPGIPSASR